VRNLLAGCNIKRMMSLYVKKRNIMFYIVERHTKKPNNLTSYWVFFRKEERKIIIFKGKIPFLFKINVSSTLVMKYIAPLDYTLI